MRVDQRFIRIILYTAPLLFVNYLFYLLGLISLLHLLYSMVLYPFGVIFVFFIWRVRDRIIGRKGYVFYKYVYIALGGWITWLVTFFGGALLILYLGVDVRRLDVPLWLSGLVFFVIPWILGGYLGYIWGKKRNFKPYEYKKR